MKKVLSLFALASVLLFGASVFAQETEVLIHDDFQSYTVGNKIALEAAAAGNDWWTTWNSTPGGSKDGVVGTCNNTKCGHLTYGNDQVLLLGNEENGVYDLEFDIFVAQGNNGYFNILHNFAGTASTWAMHCYLHLSNTGTNSSTTSAPGHGSIHAGGKNVADVACVYDAWMHFRLHIDTDNDVAEYYYKAPGESEVLVYTWQWSLDCFGENTVGRKLSAVNFYPALNSATSNFYVDNVTFTKMSGESAPALSVDADSFDFFMEEDDVDADFLTISNDGNSIGDYAAWLDFGEGTSSASSQTINYDENPDLDSGANIRLLAVGSAEPVLVEVGAMFPAASYAGSVMGAKITKAKYLVCESEYGVGIEPNTPIKFRIYEQGFYGQPGRVLAEKILPYNQIVPNAWNEVTFDTPVALTGYNVWATAEFTQSVGGFGLSMDGTSAVPGGDVFRLKGGGAFSRVQDFFDADHGNSHLRIVCQGNPVPATWASINKIDGSIMAGSSDQISINVNSIGLIEGVYSANLVIKTNDPENAEFSIPVAIHVGDDGVAENANVYSVYPNPTTSKITIEGENLNSVAIYDVAGQLIRVERLDATNVIDLDVNAGVYFLSIYDNNGNNTVQRVVVAE